MYPASLLRVFSCSCRSSNLQNYAFLSEKKTEKSKQLSKNTMRCTRATSGWTFLLACTTLLPRYYLQLKSTIILCVLLAILYIEYNQIKTMQNFKCTTTDCVTTAVQQSYLQYLHSKAKKLNASQTSEQLLCRLLCLFFFASSFSRAAMRQFLKNTSSDDGSMYVISPSRP